MILLQQEEDTLNLSMNVTNQNNHLRGLRNNHPQINQMNLDLENEEQQIFDPCINYISQCTRNNYSNRSNNQTNNNNRFRRNYTGNYKGKCNACGGENHHVNTCIFLQKVRKCLLFLEKNSRFRVEMRNDNIQNNSYNVCNTLAQKYINSVFIPYDNVNPDVFSE